MDLRYTLITLALIAMVSCTDTSITEEEELFENELNSVNSVELSAEEEELFGMVNDHRTSEGLEALEFSNEIYVYAEEHNEYMISQGELSHDHFNSRASKVSEVTSANYVAENIAKDYQRVDMALEGWLNSDSHKNTIEGDFTHATLSISFDEEGNPYYTQIFFRK